MSKRSRTKDPCPLAPSVGALKYLKALRNIEGSEPGYTATTDILIKLVEAHKARDELKADGDVMRLDALHALAVAESRLWRLWETLELRREDVDELRREDVEKLGELRGKGL